MPNFQRVLLVAVMCAAVSDPARTQSRATSWPGLWGPARNGESPATLSAIPSSAKELWRRATAGGYSEIVVGGGRAFTMELRDGADFVVALDPAMGREQWSTRVGPTFKGHTGSSDGPSSTPAIDRDMVFAAGPHGHLVALQASNGSVRWRHDLVQAFGAVVPAYGYAVSPLVENDLVIVTTGGPNSRGMLAFERATGRLVWNASHAKTPAYSSPVAATIGGVRQIVGAGGDRIFAVAPADGRLLWSIAGLGADKDLANPPLVLPGDRVLYSSWDESVMLKISRQRDVLTAAEVWRSPRLRAYNGPAVYRDGFLFAFTGPQLLCVDAANAEIKWRERTGEGTLIGIGPNLLVLGQTTGDLRVVRASPDGFSEPFRTRVFTPGVTSVTGPSFVDGRVYLRNLKELVAFSLGG
jgi:outer membrane protein assembly factor BamB